MPDENKEEVVLEEIKNISKIDTILKCIRKYKILIEIILVTAGIVIAIFTQCSIQDQVETATDQTELIKKQVESAVKQTEYISEQTKISHEQMELNTKQYNKYLEQLDINKEQIKVANKQLDLSIKQIESVIKQTEAIIYENRPKLILSGLTPNRDIHLVPSDDYDFIKPVHMLPPLDSVYCLNITLENIGLSQTSSDSLNCEIIYYDFNSKRLYKYENEFNSTIFSMQKIVMELVPPLFKPYMQYIKVEIPYLWKEDGITDKHYTLTRYYAITYEIDSWRAPIITEKEFNNISKSIVDTVVFIHK